MSDVNVTEGAPLESGQGTEVDSGTTATESREYFDPTPYANQYTRVKVDGEEIEVPVSDLISGYSRQADYTKKAQTVAEERRAIEAQKELLDAAIALDTLMQSNPDEAFRRLREAYELDQKTQQEQGQSVEPPAPTDPLSQRLQQLEVAEARRELEQVVTELQSKYGDDFDPHEVVTTANQWGVLDPHDLEGVFHQIYGQKLWALEQANREVAKQQAAADEATRAKAAQDGFVAGGSGARVTAAPPSEINDFEDAFRLGLQGIRVQH